MSIEPRAGSCDGRVLNSRRHHLPPLRDSLRYATERQIVGLRASGSEYDFVGCTANQFGDLLSRGINRNMSATAKCMAARWIAPMLLQIREHRLDDLRQHRSGCVVIEIDQIVRLHENAAPMLLRLLGGDSTLMRPPLYRKRPGFALWARDGRHTLKECAGMRRRFPWLT